MAFFPIVSSEAYVQSLCGSCSVIFNLVFYKDVKATETLLNAEGNMEVERRMKNKLKQTLKALYLVKDA
jgi:hypothetical protein